jgi:hypothetical protein
MANRIQLSIGIRICQAPDKIEGPFKRFWSGRAWPASLGIVILKLGAGGRIGE